jgi:hypothetical protein
MHIWGEALAPQFKREEIGKMIVEFLPPERYACRIVELSRDSFRNSPIAIEQTQALLCRIVMKPISGDDLDTSWCMTCCAGTFQA